jgi:putative addiction module killer protein
MKKQPKQQPPEPQEPSLTIQVYQDRNGQSPFLKWLKKLKNPVNRDRIAQTISKIQATGHIADWKTLTGASPLFEIRLHFNSGAYRLYCAWEGKSLIVLLCAGDKSTQDSDIKKAQEYWHDHKQRTSQHDQLD